MPHLELDTGSSHSVLTQGTVLRISADSVRYGREILRDNWDYFLTDYNGAKKSVGLNGRNETLTAYSEIESEANLNKDEKISSKDRVQIMDVMRQVFDPVSNLQSPREYCLAWKSLKSD